MDLGLTDRVAAIAGGSSGLGLAAANALRGEGAVVEVCARDPQRLASVADHVDGTASVDVLDHEAARQWIDDVANRRGRLDIIVANAGGPPAGMATAFDVSAYRDAVELSLLAQINLVQAALPHLRANGWGRVLFITSKTVRQPMPALALSNTARAGILGYAKSLVAELGDVGTTVNVLAPGSTRTPRLEQLAGEDVEAGLIAMAADIPLGRVGRPEEFGAVAAFVASERASFVTGTVVPVDGGEIRGL